MFLIFKKYSDLFISISKKENGSMKLLPEDSVNFARNIENREKFLSSAEIDVQKLVSAEIIHGNQVKNVDMKDKGNIIEGTDGLITNEKNIFLSVTVADCLPIFLYEPEKRVVGILHAGWRGLEKKIVNAAIEKMVEELGCAPESILAGIGPAICQNHFEVGNDVTEKFKDYPEAALSKNGKIFLDLKKITEIQFINAGLRKDNIEISQECVFELPEKYFSFRREKQLCCLAAGREKQLCCLAAGRDKKEEIDAMIAVIGMRQ